MLCQAGKLKAAAPSARSVGWSLEQGRLDDVALNATIKPLYGPLGAFDTQISMQHHDVVALTKLADLLNGAQTR